MLINCWLLLIFFGKEYAVGNPFSPSEIHVGADEPHVEPHEVSIMISNDPSFKDPQLPTSLGAVSPIKSKRLDKYQGDSPTDLAGVQGGFEDVTTLNPNYNPESKNMCYVCLGDLVKVKVDVPQEQAESPTEKAESLHEKALSHQKQVKLPDGELEVSNYNEVDRASNENTRESHKSHCGHTAHKDCVRGWMQRESPAASRCGICGQAFTLEDQRKANYSTKAMILAVSALDPVVMTFVYDFAKLLGYIFSNLGCVSTVMFVSKDAGMQFLLLGVWIIYFIVSTGVYCSSLGFRRN